MTPLQLRMARAALGLTVREVETMTGVNKNTVSRYEAGKEILAGALQRLEKLFREEGIIFLDEDLSGGDGVRLPARGGVSKKLRSAKPNQNSTKRSQKTK